MEGWIRFVGVEHGSLSLKPATLHDGGDEWLPEEYEQEKGEQCQPTAATTNHAKRLVAVEIPTGIHVAFKSKTQIVHH
jgi:hypothetical protein